MARLKLIEYLNDPTLLEQISEQEMIAWANEVPYAGLVQRLLAQKLAIENSKKTLTEQATTMAILSNANPDQVIKSIEDFKNLILNNNAEETQSDKVTPTNPILNDQSLAIKDEEGPLDSPPAVEDQVEETDLEEPSLEPLKEEELQRHQSAVEESSLTLLEEEGHDKDHSVMEESSALSEEELSSNIETLETIEGVEISEFSEWLISLQSISEKDDQEDTEIELEDKQLASDALAQLLVSQGHYSQAIAMYEILMLKVPQKSSFFADQIQKLKSL